MLGLLIPSYFINAQENKFNLSGYIIYVDAGHGGKDNGAYNLEVLEDSINLNISKFLVNDLIDAGAYVYTSRDGDYDLAGNYDKNRKAKDLKRRVELINMIKPDVFISIHLNTYKDSEVKGGQVFNQGTYESDLLAKSLQSELNNLSKKEKKTKKGNYYLLNKTNSVGVIVECGFLTNQEDLSNLTNVKYQQTISNALVKGIYEYFLDKNIIKN